MEELNDFFENTNVGKFLLKDAAVRRTVVEAYSKFATINEDVKELTKLAESKVKLLHVPNIKKKKTWLRTLYDHNIATVVLNYAMRRNKPRDDEVISDAMFVIMLLSLKADPLDSIDSRCPTWGRNAIHLAVLNRRVAELVIIIGYEYNLDENWLNQRQRQCSLGLSLYHFIARCYEPGLLDLLIEECKTDEGMRKKFELSDVTYGKNMAHYALSNRDVDGCLKIINASLDQLEVSDTSGFTPVMYFASSWSKFVSGFERLIEYLLSKTDKYNEQDANGVVRFHNLINCKDKDGCSFFYWCAQDAAPNMVKLVLKNLPVFGIQLLDEGMVMILDTNPLYAAYSNDQESVFFFILDACLTNKGIDKNLILKCCEKMLEQKITASKLMNTALNEVLELNQDERQCIVPPIIENALYWNSYFPERTIILTNEMRATYNLKKCDYIAESIYSNAVKALSAMFWRHSTSPCDCMEVSADGCVKKITNFNGTGTNKFYLYTTCSCLSGAFDKVKFVPQTIKPECSKYFLMFVASEQSVVISPCGKTCFCDWMNCPLSIVEHGSRCYLEIFFDDSRAQEYGIRARETIYDGQFVGKIVGEVITFHEAHRREKKSFLRRIELPPTMAQREQCPVLYVDQSIKSNFTKFIREVCDGNLRVHFNVPFGSTNLNDREICLFASRDVFAGEELGVAYGKLNMLWQNGEPCDCLHLNCRSAYLYD